MLKAGFPTQVVWYTWPLKSTPWPPMSSSGAAVPESNRAPFFWHADVSKSFPPAFVAFLERNGIHPDNYRTVQDVPRYLR
eukprot:7119184-Prymnesium_polylepis.1